MASATSSQKPHVVVFPFPFQGHINPMLKFAKFLHSKGFHVTFVNTEYNHNRMIKARGPHSLKGLPDFQFRFISDGLPNPDADTPRDHMALWKSMEENGFQNFRKLVTYLNNSSLSNVPPVSCVTCDVATSFSVPVAEELGIPSVVFSPYNACSLCAFLQMGRLMEKGVLPLKDEGSQIKEYLETTIDGLMGLKEMRLKDLPLLNTTLIGLATKHFKRSLQANAIIINTFEALESESSAAIRALWPQLYTLGPLHLLDSKASDDKLNSIGSNLWKEEPECIKWLDSQQPNSVIFVNFGSIAVMKPHHLIELAWGLANSNHPFLWIIRPDLVTGETKILPQDFYLETKERSLLASWVPQEEVLNHPSIGGMFFHSGWNSTVECICAGVPLICLPFVGDQMVNSRYSCAHWGIGMEIDRDLKRDDVEKVVNELMVEKKGKVMRKKVLEWKKEAEDAISPGGSSYLYLEKVVDEVLNPKRITN